MFPPPSFAWYILKSDKNRFLVDEQDLCNSQPAVSHICANEGNLVSVRSTYTGRGRLAPHGVLKQEGVILLM